MRFTADCSRLSRKSVNKEGRPVFEVHTWERLSPFSNIANMIDVMTFFVKLMLVSVVLISVMNVMIMAIYERIREIGTIAAIGTLPSKILSLYVTEGFLLGVLGALSGTILGSVIVFILNVWKIGFAFGRQESLLLAPTLGYLGVGHGFTARDCRGGRGQPPACMEGFPDGAYRCTSACLIRGRS